MRGMALSGVPHTGEVRAGSRLAPRVQVLAPSPFLAVQRAAREVEDEGRDVHYLSIGEPDFETPERVKRAGIDAITRNHTRYTATDGIPELKTAIIDKLVRDNNFRYELDEITVTPGGTQAIFNTMLATVGSGDEVILQTPFFPPYFPAVQVAGATPVLLESQPEHDFVPQPKDIARLISPRTRWLVLNSPSNPSGAVIDRETLAEIAEVVRAHPQVLVLSDDMYETVLFDDAEFVNILSVAPDLRDRSLILNGVSKAYAMTGWRIGYLAGPRDLIAGITQVGSCSHFSTSSISQAAAAEALSGPQDSTRVQRDSYQARRDLIVDLLENVPDLPTTRPRGAFFLLADCTAYFGSCTASGDVIGSDVDFAVALLRRHGVATMPGSAFGSPGYIRITFAASVDTLRAAGPLIERFCRELAGTAQTGGHA